MKYRVFGKEDKFSVGVDCVVCPRSVPLQCVREYQLVTRQIYTIDSRETQEVARLEHSPKSHEGATLELSLRHFPSCVANCAGRDSSRLELEVSPCVGAEPITSAAAPAGLTALKRTDERRAARSVKRGLQDRRRVFRYAVGRGKANRDPFGDSHAASASLKRARFVARPGCNELGSVLKARDVCPRMLALRSALRSAPACSVWHAQLRHGRWSITLGRSHCHRQAQRVRGGPAVSRRKSLGGIDEVLGEPSVIVTLVVLGNACKRTNRQ